MSKDWSTVHGQVHDRVGPQFPYHPHEPKWIAVSLAWRQSRVCMRP